MPLVATPSHTKMNSPTTTPAEVVHNGGTKRKLSVEGLKDGEAGKITKNHCTKTQSPRSTSSVEPVTNSGEASDDGRILSTGVRVAPVIIGATSPTPSKQSKSTELAHPTATIASTHPFDTRMVDHTYQAGGNSAVRMILKLKKKLKKWHEQEGSKVAESEKGCFGAAFNAWFRGGCKVDKDDVVYKMMTVEVYNINRIWNIIGYYENEFDDDAPERNRWSSKDHEEQLGKYKLFKEVPEPKSENMEDVKDTYITWAEDGPFTDSEE